MYKKNIVCTIHKKYNKQKKKGACLCRIGGRNTGRINTAGP